MDGMRGAAGADGRGRGDISDAGQCREGGPAVDDGMKVARRRQIIGILVRTSPLPFPPSLFAALRAHRALYMHTASLVAALVFYQLFEDVSLWTRVAGLPDKHYGARGGVRLRCAQAGHAR